MLKINLDKPIDRPIAFIDLETTGTSVTQDRIAEIAILRIEIDGVQKSYQTYVNPTVPMKEEATKVTGLTDDKLASYKTFKEIAAEVFDLLSGCDIAGHNIMAFDILMLDEELNRAGYTLPAGIRFIDTIRIEEKILPRNLEACYKRHTGKNPDSSKFHGAAFDTQASYEIFVHQMEVFDIMDIPNSIEDINKISTREKEVVDYAGKLKLDESGHVVYAFGKNENKRVSSDLSYCSWMLSGDFTSNTKFWINLCIKYHDEYAKIIEAISNPLTV